MKKKKPTHYVPKPAPGWPDQMPVIPRPEPLPIQLAIVYQFGYAYVYQVEKHSRLKKDRGRVKLMLRASFIECWRFAQGLVAAGWDARTYICTENTDDVSKFNWSRKYEDNPWYYMMKDRIVSTEKLG